MNGRQNTLIIFALKKLLNFAWKSLFRTCCPSKCQSSLFQKFEKKKQEKKTLSCIWDYVNVSFKQYSLSHHLRSTKTLHLLHSFEILLLHEFALIALLKQQTNCHLANKFHRSALTFNAPTNIIFFSHFGWILNLFISFILSYFLFSCQIFLFPLIIICPN